MRTDVIRSIADADADELAAGLMRSRLSFRRTPMKDGKVRILLYIDPSERPAQPEPFGTRSPTGLELTPAKSAAERRREAPGRAGRRQA